MQKSIRKECPFPPDVKSISLNISMYSRYPENYRIITN